MDKSSLNRFFLNESTDSERKTVNNWLSNPQNDLVIKSWMKENWDLISNFNANTDQIEPNVEKIWLSIKQQIQETEKPQYLSSSTSNSDSYLSANNLKKWTAAAAIFFVMLSSVAYFIYTNKTSDKTLAQSKKAVEKSTKDVPPPNSIKAELTLSDGTKINIDSSSTGKLADQGNINIVKKSNGEIIYTGAASNAVNYNTLTVPKGSKPVRLVLADGSLVWLNAASSVTFPTAFIGKERKVNITGEAYFEVTKNAEMPFYVTNNDLRIKVIGTHFNVNTYTDENDLKVTLLEGSVTISNGVKEQLLSPGQQAKLNNKSIKVITSVDLDEVMAWKNEQFYFSGTDIETIMRQLEKYYNIEVEYKDEVKYQFVAKISRHVNVSEFLKKLELTNLIHFKIEGNKIIVMK